MSKSLTIKDKSSLQLYSTGIAGAAASLLTQPLEVIKTNRINTPAVLYSDLHRKIVSGGWRAYMQGRYFANLPSSIAVFRQAFGFTLYTQMLTRLEAQFFSRLPSLNKFLNYSMSSVTAKLLAMVFQAPLTLLKTRLECVGSRSVSQELKGIITGPRRDLTKGLGTSIARQGFYTLFHYNTYRYLKDDIFVNKFHSHSTFVPAFVAGMIAITVSQPFEVVRSHISLRKFNGSVLSFVQRQWREFGLRGFFIGFLPRLMRKPINSGICWGILEWSRSLE